MRARHFLGISFAAFVLAGGAFAAEDTSTQARAAEGFYGVYATFHPSDGIPAAAGLAKYAPFITPALDKLLSDGAAAEKRFAKANKDSPPLIEGDLFTSNFEGASAYKLGACKGDAARASCAVALTYTDGKGAPVRWSDTVYLVKTAPGWRVDDISYGASWDFANKGRLSATLRQVIADSGD